MSYHCFYMFRFFATSAEVEIFSMDDANEREAETQSSCYDDFSVEFFSSASFLICYGFHSFFNFAWNII